MPHFIERRVSSRLRILQPAKGTPYKPKIPLQGGFAVVWLMDGFETRFGAQLIRFF
jgi:hypothetical protein